MRTVINGTIASIVDENHLPDIIKSLRSIEGHEVEVGIFGAEAGMTVGATPITIEQLAVIQHEGCRIKVTPKMRAYLGFLGLHVSANKDYINIPARPFLDPIMDDIEDVVERALVDAIDTAIDSPGVDLGSPVFLQIAMVIVEMLKQEITELKEPANHPWTIYLKGFDDPLMDSGRMLDAVHYEMRRK